MLRSFGVTYNLLVTANTPAAGMLCQEVRPLDNSRTDIINRLVTIVGNKVDGNCQSKKN